MVGVFVQVLPQTAWDEDFGALPKTVRNRGRQERWENQSWVYAWADYHCEQLGSDATGDPWKILYNGSQNCPTKPGKPGHSSTNFYLQLVKILFYFWFLEELPDSVSWERCLGTGTRGSWDHWWLEKTVQPQKGCATADHRTLTWKPFLLTNLHECCSIVSWNLALQKIL